MSNDKEVDWTSKLNDNEIGRDGNTEFVYLKGLQRLAKEKGIKSERYPLVNVVVMHRADTGVEYPFVQASYEVEFEDGTIFSDVADAHTYNVQGIFSAYPSAMAANRAQARALRKALGISLVAKEELGADADSIAAQRNEITTAQERVIKNLMKTKSVDDASEVIGKVCSRENIFAINELTFAEAQQAVQMLNKMKAPK